MAHRLRSFMHHNKRVLLRDAAEHSYRVLSPPLQIEVVLHIHRHWLETIWFVKDLDAPVKVQLAMSMGQKVFSPGEIAPIRNMYIIYRGSMLYGGDSNPPKASICVFTNAFVCCEIRSVTPCASPCVPARVLVRENSWGDDVILSCPRHFLHRSARAITYTDVMFLSRDSLMAAVSVQPTSAMTLRKHTLRLALRREILVRAKEMMAEAGHSGSGAIQNSGFMERVQDAVTRQHNKLTEISMNIALELQQQSMGMAPSAASPETSGSLRNRNWAENIPGRIKRKVGPSDSRGKATSSLSGHEMIASQAVLNAVNEALESQAQKYQKEMRTLQSQMKVMMKHMGIDQTLATAVYNADKRRPLDA